MAELTRYTQKLFGSTAGTDEMGEFGSKAAGTPSRYNGSTITPAIVQTLSNYLEGWYGAILGNNSPPIEDMNSLCYLFSYQLAYIMQDGIPEWDSSTTYYVGSIVSVGGVLYRSVANTNLNNAVTDGTKWTSVDGTVETSASTNTIAAGEKLTLVSATHTETMPSAATVKGQSFEIKKTDSNASTVTIAFSGGQTADGNASLTLTEQYSFFVLRSDGSNYHIVGAG